MHVSMNLRGTLPTLILEAVEQNPDHGYSIAQRIKQRSRGVLDFREGTLYPALHKLEQQGLVESHEEIENGRTRRYYRITKAGHRALAGLRSEWQRVSRAVTLILKEA
jgi:PadR family transcriptional regulator PadR